MTIQAGTSTGTSTSTSTGTCFGTNGHFRRDLDVISRLSDTTTQDLSVFIGFRCSNRVKIVVFDENIGYIRIFIKKNDFFFEI